MSQLQAESPAVDRPGRGAETAPAGSRRAPLKTLAACLAALAVLVSAPYLIDSFFLSLLIDIVVLGVLAVSCDLLVGVAGLPSLGQAAYYGVGGYAAALIAVHYASSAPVQLLVAMVSGAAAAALTGWIAVRTRGVYFLMLTLAVGQVFYSLALSLDDVTGGSDGIAGMPAPTLGGEGRGELGIGGQTYWYVLAVALVVLAITWALVRSRFGHSLRGLRQNEPRMRALGFPTSYYKYVAFMLAGGIAGIAGSLQVVNRGYFSPDELTYQVSTLALFAGIIGGRGTLVGAFYGAAVIILVRDYLASDTGGHGPLLLGILFVLVVFLLPRGLVGAARSGWAYARNSVSGRGTAKEGPV